MTQSNILSYKSLLSWLITIFLLTIFGIYTFRTKWILNLFMVKQLSSLMDTSYTAEVYPEEMTISVNLNACQQNNGSPACVHALINDIKVGLSLEDLTLYLDRLTKYPEQQLIVASYAGEFWYRNQRKNEALIVWKNWLPNKHKIIKASYLYEASQVEEVLTMLESIDLSKRVPYGVERSMVTHILVKLARKAMKSNEFSFAESLWRKAIIQYPTRADYHFNLAITLQKQMCFNEALTSLETAVMLNEQEVKYQTRLALALEQQGYIVEAKEMATAVLKIDSENEQAADLLQRIINEP